MENGWNGETSPVQVRATRHTPHGSPAGARTHSRMPGRTEGGVLLSATRLSRPSELVLPLSATRPSRPNRQFVPADADSDRILRFDDDVRSRGIHRRRPHYPCVPRIDHSAIRRPRWPAHSSDSSNGYHRINRRRRTVRNQSRRPPVPGGHDDARDPRGGRRCNRLLPRRERRHPGYPGGRLARA